MNICVQPALPVVTASMILAFALPVAEASSTFLLEYSGAEFLNGAVGEGSITFADAFPPNPSDETLFLPQSDVIAFSLTVSGATSGNGTFTLADFDYFSWNTKGIEMDLSRDLIGQATVNALLWASEEGAGGFGMGAKEGSGAPTSLQWYVLAASEGAGDNLRLISFRPEPVPLPAAVWLFGSAIAGFALAGRKRTSVG
jgi:hypothetical protein